MQTGKFLTPTCLQCRIGTICLEAYGQFIFPHTSSVLNADAECQAEHIQKAGSSCNAGPQEVDGMIICGLKMGAPEMQHKH